MIRNLLLGSVALLSLSAVAAAADLPAYAPAPVFTWTGFYLGVNGGYAGDKFTYPFSFTDEGAAPPVTVLNGSASINSSGFVGGGQIGYNYQMGAIVLGLEADIDAADIDGKLSANASGAGLGGGGLGISAGSNVDYLGTVRGRLGWAFMPRAMIYATGGYAYGGVKSSLGISGLGGGGGDSISKSTTGSGYVVGGGMEYAITDHWTFRAEYLYADLGKATLISPSDFDDEGISLKSQTKLNIVRAGINYKF